MRKRLLPSAACAALALVWFAAALGLGQPPSGPKQSFRWKFPPQNSEFRLETATDLKQSIKVTNQAETLLAQRYVMVCAYKVVSQDGETTVLQQTIESVAVQNPAGGAPAKYWQQLEGGKLTLTLNKSFQLVRLEGYEDLIKKVAGDDPHVRRVIQALVSEESVRRSIEESFGWAPQEEVAPGQSWDRKWTASLGPLGSLSVANVYTYERSEQNDAGQTLQRIAVKPKIVYSPPKADNAGLPFQIQSGELNAVEAAGTLWWNAAEGKLAGSRMRLHLVGKLKIQGKGQDAVMDLDSDQSVEIRLLKPTNQ